MTPPELPTYLDDDGLLTPEAGPWAEQKYRLVAIFNKLFSTGMKYKWSCRTYIDLFAGAGRTRIRGTNKILAGSPLLALNVADPYDMYIFCEKDEKRLDDLRARVEKSYSNTDVKFVHGDSNEKIDEICGAIPKMRAVLSFCFMDPYNIGIHFETVRRLSHSRPIDFLILLAIGVDAHRNKRDHRRIARCLGDDNWKEEWEDAERGGERFPNYFVNKYTSQMMTLGYLDTSRQTMHLVRSDKNNLPLYHLAFFSKHPLGYTFWEQARKYGLGQQSLF